MKRFLPLVLFCTLSTSTLSVAPPVQAAPISDAQIDIIVQTTENHVFERLDKLKPGLGALVKLFYSPGQVILGAKETALITKAYNQGGRAAAQDKVNDIIEGRMREAYFEMAKAGVEYVATKVLPTVLKGGAKANLLADIAAGILEPEDIALSQGMSKAERDRAFAALARMQKAESDKFWDDLIQGKTPNATELPPYLRSSNLPPKQNVTTDTKWEGKWSFAQQDSHKAGDVNVTISLRYRNGEPRFSVSSDSFWYSFNVVSGTENHGVWTLQCEADGGKNKFTLTGSDALSGTGTIDMMEAGKTRSGSIRLQRK